MLKLVLRPSEARAGRLEVIDRPPGTQVTVGGVPVAGGAHPHPPGVASVRVTPPRGAPRTLEVPISPGGVTVVDLGGALVPPAKDFRAWAWTSWGVAAAGLATGVVFHGLYEADLATERAAEGRAAVLGARDDAVRDALLAQVGYGVAVTGLVAGVLLWTASDGPEAAAASPAPGGLAWAF
jgi:hypothetical protein